jgi:plastocyanin
MKSLVLGIILGLVAISSGLSYADSTTLFQIKGSGAAVINSDNPVLYSSSMHVSLLDSSTINNGAILIKGNDGLIVARFAADQWKFTYDKDGSFHGEGTAQANPSDTFTVSLDGTRLFATGSGSMWKVSAAMQDTSKKFVLNYLLIGNDPIPTISVSNNAKILIPNGNSAQANTGFFVPLNLEVIRGTTVTWQNQDDIGHTIQSQDSQGHIISLFNSGLLKTGNTFSYKFDKPGVYHYFCTIHPWRIGTVTIS